MSRGAAAPVARIEDNLADVKALFKAKFGGDIGDDNDSEEESEDGITWLLCRRAAPSFSELEYSLSDARHCLKPSSARLSSTRTRT